MQDIAIIIIKALLVVAASIAAGLSIPFVFNRIPAKWLCDYGEDPGDEMWDIRIRQFPNGWFFVIFFAGALCIMWERAPLYLLAALLSLWILMLIAISDTKYMIIPDQLVIVLAVTAIGFIPFQWRPLSFIYGTLIGGGSLLLIGIIGRLIYKKEVMGFGDVKLMAAVGLIAGGKGTAIILILSFFSAGIIMGIGLLSRKFKRDDHKPLGPYLAGAAAAFIIFKPWLIIAADLYMNSVNL